MSVTVCIPVYNRRELVGAAVRSALNQAVDNLEVLVVDNHSSDGTWEYLQTINDARLKLVRNDSNIGMFGNFNRCGNLAQGEYILFLCSDDRLKPGFLLHALEQLRDRPSVALLSSCGIMIDERGYAFGRAGDFLPPGQYEAKSITKAFFWTVANYGINIFNYPSGILLRGDAARRALPFKDDLGGPADIDYFLKALEYGDLLIDPIAGCEIIVHRSQTAKKNKQSGTMIVDLMRLALLYRDASSDRLYWQKVHRQLSAAVFAWSLRQLKVGHFREAATATKFGFPWPTIFVAGLRRIAFLILYRLGIRAIKYAVKRELTPAKSAYSYSDAS